MPSANVQVDAISCPSCGARYRFPPAMAGKRGRCTSCGMTFTVALPESQRREPVVPAEPAPPRYIGVECRVCQTRMCATPDQVGRKLKCPDCGARTEVPPPPPPKVQKIPAALEGEQYELWDADEQPLPSALVAAQPQFIAVHCKHCDTLMYAAPDQVGQTITCPDCGKKHVVPTPPVPKPKRSVLASDAETPLLDPTAAPGELPVVVPSAHQMLYEQEREAELAAVKEIERRTGKKVLDARGRPILPRWPLVTGVWRMLVTEEVLSRWILLSIVLGFAGQFLGEALLTPIQGQAEAIKLIFTVIGGLLAVAWLAMVAPLAVAIVGESADGQDKLHQPPRLLAFDWFNELFSVAMAGSVAGLCGLGAWKLTRVAQLGPVTSAAVAAMVVLTVLPVTLLSTLLEGTPFGILSMRLVASFGRCAGAWLLFYLQTFTLAALVGGAAWMALQALRPQAGDVTTLVWLLGPLAIAALFIKMRLLGRLAWWISQRIPGIEEDEM